MSQQRMSPEELIGAMSYAELQELLEDLSMDSSLSEAIRLKRLVARLGRFESAIEAMAQQRPGRSRAA